MYTFCLVKKRISRYNIKKKLIHALNPDDDTMNFSKYEGKGIEVREMIDLCETMLFCGTPNSSGRKLRIF